MKRMIMKELHARIVRQKKFIAEVSVIGKPWRIPQSSIKTELIQVIRANKYLYRQWKRFIKLVKEENIHGSFRVFKFLVKDSLSFRVYWINKVARGWYYNLSENRLKGILSVLDRTIYNWDPNLNSVRKYIPKSDNRVRPIGVPSLHFRIVTAMWANYLQYVINPKLDYHQNGFRPEKSTATAMKSIWENSKKYEIMFEFDLVSFFNKVELSVVYKVLKSYGLPLGFINYVNWINSTPPKIFKDQLDPTDQEIKKTISKFEGGINKETEHLDKIGLPQGLAWSPILAIAVLNKVLVERYPEVSISLFADDGIIFAHTVEDIEKIKSDPYLKMAGIIFSEKIKPDGSIASKYISSKIIKFVGAELNLETGMISSPKGSIHVESELKHISKVVWNKYLDEAEKRNNNWKWPQVKNSYLIKYLLLQSFEEWLYSVYLYIKDWIDYLLHKKTNRSMRLYGLFSPYNYLEMSSFCNNLLIENLKKAKRNDNLTRRTKRVPSIEFLYRYEDSGQPLHFFNLLRWIKDEELLDIKSVYRDSMNRRFDILHVLPANPEKTKFRYSSQVPFEIIWYGHLREKMLRRYWDRSDFNALR